MKLITAVNDLDTIFEIDTEGQPFPNPPVQLMIENEPVVVTEILARRGGIIAVRVERGAHVIYPKETKLQDL